MSFKHSSDEIVNQPFFPSKFGLRPSRWTVYPVIFAQMLNYGIIRPSIPVIMLAFFNGSYSQSSLVSGIADCSGALLCFVVSPMIGRWSDANGRRKALILTLFCNCLPVLTLFLYCHFHASLWWFFAVQILCKLSTFASVYAYLSDCVAPADRSTAFAHMSGIVFVALTLGPVISRVTDMETSFRIATGLSMINMFYAIFVMPESRQKHLVDEKLTDLEIIERTLSRSHSRPLLTSQSSQSLLHDLSDDDDTSQPINQSINQSITPPTTHLTAWSTLTFAASRPIYRIIFAMVFTEQLAVYGIGEIFLLFLMRTLDFDRSLNIELSIVGGVMSIVVMFLLVPVATRQIGEKGIIVVSLVAYLVYCIAYLFVDAQWEVFLLVSLSALSTASFPATSSLLSLYVPHAEIGLAQGALSGIRALSLGVGPLVFAVVFSAFTRDSLVTQHPAAVFILGSVLTIASLVYALKLPAIDQAVYQSIDKLDAQLDDELCDDDRDLMNGGDYGSVHEEERKMKV